ncbi:MAG: transcriptional repressor [Oscillospiraceae bacterium]|nr:transcriptional repressor [Oscillospiraceae bacterium]
MQRNSKKRAAILAALQGTRAHPTADWIYRQLKPAIPGLSLGTVYHNLVAFKEAGLAVGVATVDGKERFDGNTAPHAHFICKKCGAVLDVWEAALPEGTNLPGTAESCRLTWYGVCEGCQAKKIV